MSELTTRPLHDGRTDVRTDPRFRVASLQKYALFRSVETESVRIFLDPTNVFVMKDFQVFSC